MKLGKARKKNEKIKKERMKLGKRQEKERN